MNRSLALTFVAAALAANGAFAQGNISQNQSGSGNNQSLSIGGDDSKPAKKSTTRSKKSVQRDSVGNTQSSDVSGGGSGNVSQNQTGSGNSQGLSIGGNTGGKLPTVTQNQKGTGREQTTVIDGKKVEQKSN